MNNRILTGGVVVAGLFSLAICARYGVDKEVMAAIGGAIIILAGTMKGAK